MKQINNSSTLAIKGGKKRVRERILPFNSIGSEEKKPLAIFWTKKHLFQAFMVPRSRRFLAGLK